MNVVKDTLKEKVTDLCWHRIVELRKACTFVTWVRFLLSALMKKEKEENNNKPKCLFCGRKKTVQKQEGDIYFCTYCLKLFDLKD